MAVQISTGRATGWTIWFRGVGDRQSTGCHSFRTSMSRIEPVARAAHRDEVTRLLGVGLEPAAQLTDKVIDRTHRACGLAPHELEQLRAREHLVWMAHEEREQLELEMGEL